jgi:hypothetical protein
VVITTEECNVVTSASPLQTAVRETGESLEELSQHELLSESWRRRLQGASRRVGELADGPPDPGALRAVRALAATAASESALAARFEGRLLTMSNEQLEAANAQLEHGFAALRGTRAEADAHLESAVGELLGESPGEMPSGLAAAAGRQAIRRRARLADDIVAAMRAYADRIEQLLLDLGEAAHAAVGAPAGGLLPARVSHVPPRPDLQDDATWLPDELRVAVSRLVDQFRDRLADQVEEAIETLRARVDRMVRCRALGERAVSSRAGELALIARRMDQLAEALDWMLLDDR